MGDSVSTNVMGGKEERGRGVEPRSVMGIEGVAQRSEAGETPRNHELLCAQPLRAGVVARRIEM